MAQDEEPVYGYVIYRFNDGEKIDIDNPKNILKIKYDAALGYDDNTIIRGKTYFYVVTALDRMKNESERSPTIAVTVP
jgi:fibronectin type 3 domain-containing protein